MRLAVVKQNLIGVVFIMLATLSQITQAEGRAPMEVEGAVTIDTKQAKEMWLQGAKFFDPRTENDFEVGHIPNAINISRTNPEVYTRANIEAQFAKDEAIVIYCNGPGCLRSARTSSELVALGYQKVYYYRDGFPAWTFSGHPVE